MQGRESGPGYLTSLGTEPPLCAFRTLRRRVSSLNEEVLAKWTPRFGGVKSGRRPGNNSSLHGRRSLASSPTKCDPIPKKWGMSPYATEDEAPASVGARVMERISPSELWRMATTG